MSFPEIAGSGFLPRYSSIKKPPFGFPVRQEVFFFCYPGFCISFSYSREISIGNATSVPSELPMLDKRNTSKA